MLPHAADDESLLVDQLRAGRADALEELIRRYEGRLSAFLRRRLSDPQACEDILQEVFIGFLRALPNYDRHRSSLETFLFRIASHKLVDELRRRQREATAFGAASGTLPWREGAGDLPTASSLVRRDESQQRQAEWIANELGRLIAVWKRDGQWERLKCAELLFVLGWPNKRVAQTLGISEQAVANHKSFILSKLKQAGSARSGETSAERGRL